MLSVTTSSWSTDIGYTTDTNYSLAQEAGIASGKTRGKADSAFETLSTAFFSPSWEVKKGRIELPLSGALYSKNFGDASELIGPAINGGAVAHWFFSRTHFVQAKGLAGWAKTYSVMRSNKDYAVDPGFERSDTQPWRVQQQQFSLLNRLQTSQVSHLNLQISSQSIAATHANKELSAARTSHGAKAFFSQELSNRLTLSGGVNALTWEKRPLLSGSSSQSATHVEPLTEVNAVFSDRLSSQSTLGVPLLASASHLSALNASTEWMYRLSHHAKATLLVRHANDDFSLDGKASARTQIKQETQWRDFSKMAAGVSIGYEKSKTEKMAGAFQTTNTLNLETSFQWNWSDIGVGARASYSQSRSANNSADDSSRTELWLTTEWPFVAEKKEL